MRGEQGDSALTVVEIVVLAGERGAIEEELEALLVDLEGLLAVAQEQRA